MAMQPTSRESDGINEINITPFVDIVLVLLIIFMISTPAMILRGTKVSLPKAKRSEDMSHVTLNLMIQKDGTLLLDNRQVSLEDVKKAFQKLLDNKMPGDAVISADSAVPHGKVMEVSDVLRELGITQIGFGTAGGTARAKQSATTPPSKEAAVNKQ